MLVKIRIDKVAKKKRAGKFPRTRRHIKNLRFIKNRKLRVNQQS
jgi:hypothetical protein